MARAFFYAGAHALLVSHWYVDSHAAVKITTSTFAELKRDPAIGRAEALRRAMLAAMADTSRPTNWTPASHPAVWAPFVLVGEGAPASPTLVPGAASTPATATSGEAPTPVLAQPTPESAPPASSGAEPKTAVAAVPGATPDAVPPAPMTGTLPAVPDQPTPNTATAKEAPALTSGGAVATVEKKPKTVSKRKPSQIRSRLEHEDLGR